MAIGGADMPVVVSLLNSYSGWAAAAAGFVLANDLLIVTGALVGASGAILSIIMCRAMNRSILNVVFGGFGTGEAKAAARPRCPRARCGRSPPTRLAARLRAAKNVIIVPGYGMAVARAQNAVNDLTRVAARAGRERALRDPPGGGPSAGAHERAARRGRRALRHRPGDGAHQPRLRRQTDVVLVIGANDIVNPGALDDAVEPDLRHAGARGVEGQAASVVLKRGMAAGYAGVENPLFYLENTRMLFGDARKSIESLLGAVNTKKAA